MNITEVLWTKKMQAVMQDNSQVLYLVGATGCSKSLLAGHKFMQWILNAPKGKKQFYIIAKDRGTGARNILENPDGIYNLFKYICEPYREGIDGLQFIVHTKTEDKIVYIVGADNREAWSKVLGGNPAGLWLEELTVLHIDCIRECMTRALSRNCNILGTTNGGMPNQEVYTEFINHAVVQFRDSVPPQELADMEEDRKYSHYYHFNLEDDAPHMSEQQRQNLKIAFPPNSFYYMSKVMGCRGFAEGVAYATLMNKNIHLIPYDSINLNMLEEINLYVDIGSNRNINDESKASTVANLVGYTRGCQRVVVLEAFAINATSHDDIIKYCEDELRWYFLKYMERTRKIVIDSAESILIHTWKERNRYPTISVKGAVKSVKNIITLVSRCTLKQQLLAQKRLLWTDKALKSYNAHTKILLDKDGSELDLSNQENDFGDVLSYALTEKWNDITNQTRR